VAAEARTTLGPNARYLGGLGTTLVSGAKKIAPDSVQRTGPGIATLDDTPSGNFLELGGPEYRMDVAARRLGFPRETYVPAKPARLYRAYQNKNPGVSALMALAAKVAQKPQTKEP
jgi:hypothetical protein